MNKSSRQLIQAVRDEDYELVAELLESGINVNARDEGADGNTVLYYAVLHKSTKILELLLEHGAYVEAVGYAGTRAIDTALMVGRSEHLKVLLEHGSRVTVHTVVQALKHPDRREDAELLFQHVDLLSRDANSMSIVHLAVLHDDSAGLEILLKRRGVPVNDRTQMEGLTPLHLAAKRGNVKCLELLVKYGAKLHLKDELGLTALHKACSRTPAGNRFVLHDQLEVIRRLLESGADVNATTNNGVTALHFAANNSMIEYIEILIKSGANPRLKDTCGDTPLHRIANQSKTFETNATRQLRAIRLFLSAGANVNCQNNKGLSPLYLFTSSMKPECVEFLLQNGADPNLKEAHGYAPLHSCTSFRIGKVNKLVQNKVAQMLLNAGANIDDAAENGKTPLHYAMEGNNTGIIRVLLKHMAIYGHSYDKVASIERVLGMDNGQNIQRYNIYFSRCTDEINEMKRQKVLGKVSLYDFLAKKTKTLSKLIRNPKAIKSLIARNVPRLFPRYCRILKRSFYEIIERNELMEDAASAVSELTNFQIDSTNIATEKILNFLSPHDWKSLAATLDDTDEDEGTYEF